MQGGGKGGARPSVAAQDDDLVASGPSFDATVLAPEDAWIAGLDHATFKADIQRLGRKLRAQQGPEDMAHLHKIILWSRASMVIGYATMWIAINPVSVYLLSVSCMTRWAIIGHHTCHGGYDKCSAGQYSRFTFGVGSLYRRCADWLDWMLVEAWKMEHNKMHHYHLGEIEDPDFLEHNFLKMRQATWPKAIKYGIVLFVFMPMWKWLYYASNTLKILKLHEMQRRGEVPRFKNGQPIDQAFLEEPCMVWETGYYFSAIEFYGHVLAPFFLRCAKETLLLRCHAGHHTPRVDGHLSSLISHLSSLARWCSSLISASCRNFVLIPALAGILLGRDAGLNSLASMVLAEWLTNAHAFLNIAPNHTGVYAAPIARCDSLRQRRPFATTARTHCRLPSPSSRQPCTRAPPVAVGPLPLQGRVQGRLGHLLPPSGHLVRQLHSRRAALVPRRSQRLYARLAQLPSAQCSGLLVSVCRRLNCLVMHPHAPVATAPVAVGWPPGQPSSCRPCLAAPPPPSLVVRLTLVCRTVTRSPAVRASRR